MIALPVRARFLLYLAHGITELARIAQRGSR